MISIHPHNGAYAVRFRFDRALLDKIKTLPARERQWDSVNKVWLIAPSSIDRVKQILESHTGQTITLPELAAAQVKTETKQFILQYIGRCKDQSGQSIAMGLVGDQWLLEFPEKALRDYFGDSGEQLSLEPQTYYQVLCVQESVSQADIKKAHRMLARQWHPDVCKETDAAEKFRKIQEAYEALSDPVMRKRYDAGLFYERAQEVRQSRRPFNPNSYRSPYLCGLVNVEGQQVLSRFCVSRIISWSDYVNESGQTMVSSWDSSISQVRTMWI
jgi:hypothetical protein